MKREVGREVRKKGERGKKEKEKKLSQLSVSHILKFRNWKCPLGFHSVGSFVEELLWAHSWKNSKKGRKYKS